MCVVLSGDARLSDPTDGEEEPAGQEKKLPSCWYQRATGKLFSRWLIITQWLGTWGATKHLTS